LNGKIKKIIELIKKPKDKTSKSYLQADKNATTLLYGTNWFIWGIKNTMNKQTKKMTDILIINKHNKAEFKIINWKRCQRVKGKGIHSWHYELYLSNTFLTDGEYITDDYRYAQQSDFIRYIMDIIRKDYYETFTKIADCGHRTDQIINKNDQKLCFNCNWKKVMENIKK